MITKVILGLVNIVDVGIYLLDSVMILAFQSVLCPYGPPASLYPPIHSVRQAAWGAPLGGARRLPKSLCREGAKNEKNVGRPRAAAVAAGGIIKWRSPFFCKYSREYLPFY
nr:MAG TPA: hypothetical protein [Microviridae sp.]